ncbi:MAG TPA: pilus assembly protein TadG-related protein [Trebonia sp.]|jgi:Flp pilus assembly protein TadG|nr:pilus assembly protein TadG-related protein [Trebonia sp.]
MNAPETPSPGTRIRVSAAEERADQVPAAPRHTERPVAPPRRQRTAVPAGGPDTTNPFYPFRATAAPLVPARSGLIAGHPREPAAAELRNVTLRRLRPRRRWRCRADRGSISLWLVIFAFTTIALLVLVVDGGQTMNAKSRAADIAEQAARAAADDVNVGQLRGGTIGLGGDACDLQQGPAAQLVASYAAGVPGATATLINCTPSVTDVGGNPSVTVTATVQISVRPALPVPPFTTISATAQETAYLACGSADQREAC